LDEIEFIAFIVNLFLAISGGSIANYLTWIVLSFWITIQDSKSEEFFHKGFLELYKSGYGIWGAESENDTSNFIIPPIEKVQSIINEIIESRSLKPKTITAVGHSLGGSMAIICAYHIGKSLNESSITDIPINCVTFACPKTASPTVFENFKSLGINHYHYLNRGDVVPVIMSGIFTNGLGYENNHFLRMDPVNLNNLKPSNQLEASSPVSESWNEKLNGFIGEKAASGILGFMGYIEALVYSFRTQITFLARLASNSLSIVGYHSGDILKTKGVMISTKLGKVSMFFSYP